MIKHYLVTVATFNGINVHGYLVTNREREYVQQIVERILGLAEEKKLKPLGIVLMTTLANEEDGPPDENSIGIVREILCRMDSRIAQTLKLMTNYHLSVVAMKDNDPDNKVLMELH